jgi:hypothetical protein
MVSAFAAVGFLAGAGCLGIGAELGPDSITGMLAVCAGTGITVVVVLAYMCFVVLYLEGIL